MKAIIALLMVSAFVVRGQTNDVIPLFQSDGRTYTNARITSVNASYAIVMFDGGGKRVKVEDLPEPFKSKYYDPKSAEIARNAAEAKKRYAEQSAALRQAEAWVGETGTVKLHSIDGTFGGLPKCTVSYSGGRIQIIISGLPQATIQEFSRYTTLGNEIETQKQTVRNLKAELAQAEVATTAASDLYYQSARVREKQAYNNLDQANDKLSDMMREYKSLLDDLLLKQLIRARPTGKVSGGLRIWEYVAQAPPEK